MTPYDVVLISAVNYLSFLLHLYSSLNSNRCIRLSSRFASPRTLIPQAPKIVLHHEASMALQFNVTSVDAAVGQRQPISTGFEQNRQISNQDQIWPLGQPNPAGTNSSLPVAFEIQANVLAGVTLRGNFNFDAAWRAPGSMYTVSTTAPGAAMFRSARSLVPIDPADNTVIAQQFTMLNPLAQAAPFKCTGDWTWTITHINPNGQ